MVVAKSATNVPQNTKATPVAAPPAAARNADEVKTTATAKAVQPGPDGAAFSPQALATLIAVQTEAPHEVAEMAKRLAAELGRGHGDTPPTAPPPTPTPPVSAPPAPPVVISPVAAPPVAVPVAAPPVAVPVAAPPVAVPPVTGPSVAQPPTPAPVTTAAPPLDGAAVAAFLERVRADIAAPAPETDARPKLSAAEMAFITMARAQHLASVQTRAYGKVMGGQVALALLGAIQPAGGARQNLVLDRYLSA